MIVVLQNYHWKYGLFPIKSNHLLHLCEDFAMFWNVPFLDAVLYEHVNISRR